MKLVDPITGLRRFFYLITPNETSFEHEHEVPNYINECIPYFIVLVLLEYFICLFKGKKGFRLNDGFTSAATGIASQLPSLFGRSIEVSSYIIVHNYLGIFTLPWDSPWAWILCFFGVDFGYYWVHRMSHEVSLFWSGHQAHHSSEDYNLTTALRKSVLQPYFAWFFYFPLALFIPPTTFLVHLQFNLIYQFWIHTELVGKLGPLEWILNTPSHHRVHHGRNPYCIDKNYGGTLIVFDRLFGTFAEERDSEKVYYGLVHPLKTFDQVEIQICHLRYLWPHVRKQKTLLNQLKALMYGPGWDEGKPRLGDPNDLPNVKIIEKNLLSSNPTVSWDPQVDNSLKLYCFLQFALITIFFNILIAKKDILSNEILLTYSIVIMISLTIVGNLFQDTKTHPFKIKMEFARNCLLLFFVVCLQQFIPAFNQMGLRLLFSFYGRFIITIITGASLAFLGWKMKQKCD